MKETRIVRVGQEILAENRTEAAAIRGRLERAGCTMINVMASPGGGKTSLILRTVEALRSEYRIAVVEADLDSTVDADKFTAIGVPAVQLETGGYCHVDARMSDAALAKLDLTKTDLIFLENVGNLICTAQSQTGAHLNVAILSVPEGDDKPLKYPIMFRHADVVVLNKIDYLAVAEFDIEAFEEHLRTINREVPLLLLSCKTAERVDSWLNWLTEQL